MCEEICSCISGIRLSVSFQAPTLIFEVKDEIKMNETIKRQMGEKMCHTGELTICLNLINLKLIPVID